MARRSVLGLAAGAAIVTSLSCTLVADLDVKQCSKDADCAKYGDQFAGYACQDEICVDFKCSDDASCRVRGGTYADSICVEQECVAPECKMDMECSAAGPTATCKSGRCVDELWGCLNDPPPADSPKTLKFEGPLIDFATRTPTVNTRAFLCRSSPPGCNPPVSGPHGLNTNGILSIPINGVETTGFDGYVRIEADNPDTMMPELPMLFVFPRPLRQPFVVDGTRPLAMIRPGTIDQFSVLFPGVMVDEATTGLITLRLFDCLDQPAANLRLALNNSMGERFYVTDSEFKPDVDAVATDEAGIAGLMNVLPGLQTINVIYNPTGEELFHFRAYTQAATFTLGFVYAQDVRTADD
jgi:hypothetical protein